MPSTLVTIDLEAFRICDAYTFAATTSLSSPQFIPDPERTGDRGGWLTCVVWTSDASWLWVFDAENLAQGPIAELSVPTTLGFSLHTAWLPNVTATPDAGAVSPSAAASAAARTANPDARAAHVAFAKDAIHKRMSHLKPKARKRIEDFLAAKRPKR